MPRSEADRRRLTMRARTILQTPRLLHAIATSIRDTAALDDLLADVSDPIIAARLRDALVPLVSFSAEAPSSAAPGSVVSAALKESNAMGNQSLKSLDHADHLTKRSGGTPTHSAGNFKTPELPQRAKSAHSGGGLKEPIGPASSGNYGPPAAKGAHGAKTIAPHKYNKAAAGKKLNQ